jgi:hypothetical protein
MATAHIAINNFFIYLKNLVQRYKNLLILPSKLIIICIFAAQKMIIMKKLSILFIICIALMAVGDAYAQRSKRSKRRT